MLIVGDVNNKIKKMTEEEKTFGIDKLNVKRSEFSGDTFDYSARIQTVSKSTNPKYYDLIKKFKERTDCPVIVNTFNVRGEPIVNTPEDAFKCFRTNLDKLVIGNFILEKDKQDLNLRQDYKSKFDLD